MKEIKNTYSIHKVSKYLKRFENSMSIYQGQRISSETLDLQG